MTIPFTTDPYHFSRTKKQHMLPYPKDTATKYLIIRTETCTVILPGW